MKTLRYSIFICIPFILFFTMDASGGTIVTTKHNLSVSGPGPIKSLSEMRICIFCHTPHRARRDIQFLWNRQDSGASYTPYQSTTLYANVGQPSGASKLCLSCHDGTIALGAVLSEPAEIPFIGGVRFIPVGLTRLETDLSDDHPVSFTYDSGNPELVNSASLPPEVRLDGNGELQCTACHDPHVDDNGKFLALPNNFSGLCTTCHQKNGWTLASHATSNRTWGGSGIDPWQHTPYTTVAENGCENCHNPHTAGGHERILNYAINEDNCLVCHNVNVDAASTDIESELSKLYGHFVQDYSDQHDPAEDFTTGPPDHVECTDCHNPHWANANPSPGAPQVSGPISGVKGISTTGSQVSEAANQYEICYKCHAGNNVLSAVPIARQIQQLDTSLEFDPSNPSFHPVETQGKNTNVPSLIVPYTTASKIFCTDCHNNDDPVGPSGPHGSDNEPLLELNYTTADNTTENTFNYELCYKCHDRSSILNDESFKERSGGGGGGGMNRGGHSGHIVTENVPCSACHDAHGISSTQGNSTNNSNLINFDTTIVAPVWSQGQWRLYFEDLGTFAGRCYLSCHGQNHSPKTYP